MKYYGEKHPLTRDHTFLDAHSNPPIVFGIRCLLLPAFLVCVCVLNMVTKKLSS